MLPPPRPQRNPVSWTFHTVCLSFAHSENGVLLPSDLGAPIAKEKVALAFARHHLGLGDTAAANSELKEASALSALPETALASLKDELRAVQLEKTYRFALLALLGVLGFWLLYRLAADSAARRRRRESRGCAVARHYGSTSPAHLLVGGQRRA